MRLLIAAAALLVVAVAVVSCYPVVWSPSPNSPSRAIAFACEDGTELSALYEVDDGASVLLSLSGRQVRLPQVVAVSGARYAGEGLQWWDRGDEAMLAPLAEGEDIASAPRTVCRAE